MKLKRVLLAISSLTMCLMAFPYDWYGKFSAVNPGLLLYSPQDVVIVSPTKVNDGKHVISPDTVAGPWEARLENGMPNTIVSDMEM